MLETKISMNVLAVIGGNESVGTNEMYLRLWANEVGNDSRSVFVGIDLREHPFCADSDKFQGYSERY